MKSIVNNLGIPPLAGICTYEEAGRSGYDVEYNVNLLKRYNYIKSQMVNVYSAHLARTPEWEVKCAFGLHLWLDAEHGSMLRKRVSEMREPPLGLDKVPDERLKSLFDELIRSEDTVELLVGIYGVVKPALLRAMQQHMDITNPIADHPTVRMLRIMIQEEVEMVAWGKEAITALTASEEKLAQVNVWARHLEFYLERSGGINGEDRDVPVELSSADESVPVPRSDGGEYRMDPTPARDSRFVDPCNASALIDDYYQDDTLQYDERAYALYYKRLREMDVPEWMGPIIYNTKGKPWEYYRDLSRQLWDEARHAMLGEIGLVMNGVPFYKYPIDMRSSLSLNTELAPFDGHVILWAIEQELMNAETGKRWEWKISAHSELPHAKLMQDYDWADEVLHAQIGRKFLLPQFESMEELKAHAKRANDKWYEIMDQLMVRSEQREWWPVFLEEIRKQRAYIQEM